MIVVNKQRKLPASIDGRALLIYTTGSKKLRASFALGPNYGRMNRETRVVQVRPTNSFSSRYPIRSARRVTMS